MRRSALLLADAVINLFLGVLLILFTGDIVRMLGVPEASTRFYPNILGGVLFGIGLALLIEYFRRPDGIVGLGLAGAMAINLCGGAVLAAWLLLGRLDIPLHGRIFLWALVVLLVLISGAEGLSHHRSCRKQAKGK
jgi:hypothetical protein